MLKNYFFNLLRKKNIFFVIITMIYFKSFAAPVVHIAPTLTGISNDSGINTTDFITNDTTPVLFGKAEPLSVITIEINGLSTSLFNGSVVTNSDGDFSFDFEEVGFAELSDGTFNIIVESTHNGNTTKSDSQTITLDTKSPEIESCVLIGSPSFRQSSISFLVSFNESSRNISTDDFELITTNTVRANIASVSPNLGVGNSIVVNVDITNPNDDEGTIKLKLKDNTNIQDTAGNGNGTNGYVLSSSSSDTYYLSETTLSSSENLNESFKITHDYDTLTISSNDDIDMVLIYDVFGKLIIQTKKTTINTSFLTSGIYIISIKKHKQIINKKMFI